MAYTRTRTSTTLYTIGDGLVQGHPELRRACTTMDSYIKQHLQDIAKAGVRLKPTDDPEEYEKLRGQWEALKDTLGTREIVNQLPKKLKE